MRRQAVSIFGVDIDRMIRNAARTASTIKPISDLRLHRPPVRRGMGAAPWKNWPADSD
jgi:hypothetical protein